MKEQNEEATLFPTSNPSRKEFQGEVKFNCSYSNPDLLLPASGLLRKGVGSEADWEQSGPNEKYHTFSQQPFDPDGQTKQKKSVTKTVQQAPNPTIIPSSPAIQGDNPDEPQSSHPSAGHTPGPQTPVNSPKNPPPSPV